MRNTCRYADAKVRSAPQRLPPHHKLLERMIASVPVTRPRPTRERPQHLCLDKGYGYLSVRAQVQRLGFEPHIRSRGEEAQRKKRNPRWRARRWVVERTNSWHGS